MYHLRSGYHLQLHQQKTVTRVGSFIRRQTQTQACSGEVQLYQDVHETWYPLSGDRGAIGVLQPHFDDDEQHIHYVWKMGEWRLRELHERLTVAVLTWCLPKQRSACGCGAEEHGEGDGVDCGPLLVERW